MNALPYIGPQRIVNVHWGKAWIVIQFQGGLTTSEAGQYLAETFSGALSGYSALANYQHQDILVFLPGGPTILFHAPAYIQMVGQQLTHVYNYVTTLWTWEYRPWAAVWPTPVVKNSDGTFSPIHVGDTYPFTFARIAADSHEWGMTPESDPTITISDAYLVAPNYEAGSVPDTASYATIHNVIMMIPASEVMTVDSPLFDAQTGKLKFEIGVSAIPIGAGVSFAVSVVTCRGKKDDLKFDAKAIVDWGASEHIRPVSNDAVGNGQYPDNGQHGATIKVTIDNSLKVTIEKSGSGGGGGLL